MSEGISSLALSKFAGSETYYKISLFDFAPVITEGVKYLLDTGELHWFFDLIVSYQLNPELLKKGEAIRQFWTLQEEGESGAIALCCDGNEKEILRQKIDFTDFKFGRLHRSRLHVWVIDGVALLPGEY